MPLTDWARNFPSTPSKRRDRPRKNKFTHSHRFHIHILANEIGMAVYLSLQIWRGISSPSSRTRHSKNLACCSMLFSIRRSLCGILHNRGVMQIHTCSTNLDTCAFEIAVSFHNSFPRHFKGHASSLKTVLCKTLFCNKPFMFTVYASFQLLAILSTKQSCLAKLYWKHWSLC